MATIVNCVDYVDDLTLYLLDRKLEIHSIAHSIVQFHRQRLLLSMTHNQCTIDDYRVAVTVQRVAEQIITINNNSQYHNNQLFVIL